MHWSERFLVYGYKNGAEGPLLYDCWSFFRLVQKEQFGREVPFMPSPASRGATARAMPEWAGSFGWTPIAADQVATGDAVFMSFLKQATHVGVYVGDVREPSILHCPEGGPGLHTVRKLKDTHWRLRSYWRAPAGAA